MTFICCKKRDKKGVNKLRLVESYDKQSRIWQKARELNDGNMLHRIQGHGDECIDMVASDFRYHDSCIAAYVKIVSCSRQQRRTSTDTDDEITLGLQKKTPEKYQHVILRMGEFHIANNYLGVIGKLFKSSGIEVIMVDGGIFRTGTMNKIMSCKDYYGMVRCHTLLMSAMLELYWETFVAWSFEKPDVNLDVMADVTNCIRDLIDAVDKNAMLPWMLT